MPDLPYISPLGEFPPSDDLIVLFLEAVARKTPAFTDLRESVFMTWEAAGCVEDLVRWRKKWGLDIDSEPPYLADRIIGKLEMILDTWQRDPLACAELRVDCGWWNRKLDPSRRLAGDRAPATLSIEQWNSDREPFDVYRDRIRAGIEVFLQEQRDSEEAWMKRYSMRSYSRRARDRDFLWDFEWLALWICCKLSDAKIARRPEYSGVSIDAVRKARRQLQRNFLMASLTSSRPR